MAVLSALRKRFEDECLHRPFSALPVIGDDGLVLGRGTVLARLAMTRSGEICLAVEADEERVVALLSATYGRPVAPAVMKYVARASEQWRRGDKALAHIELAFARLPRLTSEDDAFRLFLAADLLANDVTPEHLTRELGLETPLAKYDPDEPRVPAGHGRESGRWARFWSAVSAWLDEEVTEYDPDSGREVGARSRGQIIATNPITIGLAGAAVFLAGEALLAGGAALVTGEAALLAGEAALLPGEAALLASEAALPPAAAPATGVAANAARGLASEARVLKELGLTRNTRRVVTDEGGSVPDALTDTASYEIKDKAYVAGTRQVRIQTDAAKLSGRRSILITGTRTSVSKQARRAFDKVIERTDLGPK